MTGAVFPSILGQGDGKSQSHNPLALVKGKEGDTIQLTS